MYLNTIDRAKPEKLYCQILEMLREQIEKGEWRVGTRIPTEEQLCNQYNVSRATVRLALEELVSSGYLKKFQGKGTFVRRRKPENTIAMIMNPDEDELYCEPSYATRVIENKILEPDNVVGEYLNLSCEDHCFFLTRLVIADSTPLLLQKIHITYSFLPSLKSGQEIADISPFVFLENRFGIKIQRVKEMVDVANITEEDAVLLEMKPDLPVLRTRHICYANGDLPISFFESFHRTEKYPKMSEFERIRI